MFVKYQHARSIAIAVGAIVVVGLVVLICGGVMSADDEPNAVYVPDRAPIAGSKAPKARAPSGSASKRYREVMAAADRAGSPNSKRKDALGPGGWKINLYEETGDTQYDRAKIDKDRDDNWDESLSFKKGRWEKDGGASIWDGRAWVSSKASSRRAARRAETPAPGAGGANSEHEALAKRFLSESAKGAKAKDVTKGRGAKANFYDDDKDGRWDRAKIDKDRDDSWDEKWTIKGGHLERKIEATGAVFVYTDGSWVPKK